MKQKFLGFLKKRWHGIPVGVLAVALLVVAVVAASYLFLWGTVDIGVTEPLTVRVYIPPGDWITLTSNFALSVPELSAGSTLDGLVQFISTATNNLTVTMNVAVTACPEGGEGMVSWTGGPWTVLRGAHIFDDVSLTIGGAAPVGNYTVAVNFTRS